MNPRYRKVMRLRSRHYRRGHTPWCKCPELIQAAIVAINHLIREGKLNRRSVSYRNISRL